MTNLFLIILLCFLTVCGQICIKLGLSANGGFWFVNIAFWQNITKWLLSPLLVIGFLIYGIATILFMYLINKLQLNYFYPLTSITYIMAFLAGHFIFQESVSFSKIIGTLIIIVGVIFITIDPKL